MLSTFNVNHTTIAFLSNMIENVNRRNVSAARIELSLLLPQQIELVKTIEEKTWEESEEYAGIVWELEEKFNRDECEENFQEYSSALTKSEEITAELRCLV